MRIFDVVNKNNCGFFCMAKDEQDALALAKEVKHLRTSPKRIIDITENLKNENGISELMTEQYRGRLSKQITAISFDQLLVFPGMHSPSCWMKWGQSIMVGDGIY
jgi:uncharacterized protein YjiK